MSEAGARVLGIDIGGTKTLIALIEEGRILESRSAPTKRDGGPEDWVRDAAALAGALSGEVSGVAAAVSGGVRNGLWSALNPATLNVPEGFPLVRRLEAAFGLKALAVNDAQAAAWAEHRFGAARGKDMVFLTISTGVGGGVVMNGRLLRGRGGVAGHFGVTGLLGRGIFENRVSGRWMAAEAARAGAGPGADARSVFSEAEKGAGWAKAIIDQSARRMAELLCDIQMTLDPEVIVLGGGIGLAPGYIDGLAEKCAALPDYARPLLRPAKLGADAGVLGAAALFDPDK